MVLVIAIGGRAVIIMKNQELLANHSSTVVAPRSSFDLHR
jgi:hypothetical protein